MYSAVSLTFTFVSDFDFERTLHTKQLKISLEMSPPKNLFHTCSLGASVTTNSSLHLSLLTKSSFPLEGNWVVGELRMANFTCRAGFWCFRT